MSFWKDRNVFVTGATGLLGSWMVKELIGRGANVISLMRDWVPDSNFNELGFFETTTVVRGELEDYTVLLRALNEYEVDSVFHLGAQAIVGTATRSALSTFESNVRGTWNLLEACRSCSKTVERIVVASSDKAYGHSDRLPYREDAPLQGRYPYEVSKSCADLISLSYFHAYRTPLAITRCGNLFGGGDLNFNRLIPGTIRSALMDQPPVIRSDGTYVRDYFYVQDAVRAYLKLAEHLPGEGFVGEAFNFGNETPISVLDAVDQILDLMDRRSLGIEILNESQGEIAEQYLDCTKARNRLGWRPEFTFEQALRETILWYKDHLQPESKPAPEPVR